MAADQTLINWLTITDMMASLAGRFEKYAKLNQTLISEQRDATDDEVLGFRQEAEDMDTRLTDAIEAKRQRELIGGVQSDKITGDTGGDLRP